MLIMVAMENWSSDLPMTSGSGMRFDDLPCQDWGKGAPYFLDSYLAGKEGG